MIRYERSIIYNRNHINNSRNPRSNSIRKISNTMIIEQQIAILEESVSRVNCPEILLAMNKKYRELHEQLKSRRDETNRN